MPPSGRLCVEPGGSAAPARRAARRGGRRTPRAAGRCARRGRCVASQRAAAAWSTVDECRSAACLAIVSGRSSIRGARTQPIRRPGAAIFDSVEIASVRSPAPGSDAIAGQRLAAVAQLAVRVVLDQPQARRARPPRPAPGGAPAAACGRSGCGTSGPCRAASADARRSSSSSASGSRPSSSQGTGTRDRAAPARSTGAPRGRTAPRRARGRPARAARVAISVSACCEPLVISRSSASVGEAARGQPLPRSPRAAPGRPRSSSTAARGRPRRRRAPRRTPRAGRRRRTARAPADRRRTR